MAIEIKLAYDEKDEIKKLFTEYTELLIERDPEAAIVLKQQNYDEEVSQLRERYGRPQGSMYIAYVDGKPAGCGGLHRIDADTCELKRLYVRPGFRGHHLAKVIFEQILADAKEGGYRGMVLDTFPVLTEAIEMYKNYGFYEIPRYNDNPLPQCIYYKKDI